MGHPGCRRAEAGIFSLTHTYTHIHTHHGTTHTHTHTKLSTPLWHSLWSCAPLHWQTVWLYHFFRLNQLLDIIKWSDLQLLWSHIFNNRSPDWKHTVGSSLLVSFVNIWICWSANKMTIKRNTLKCESSHMTQYQRCFLQQDYLFEWRINRNRMSGCINGWTLNPVIL